MNWLSAEQSNSSMIVGDVAMLKLFRRVAVGPHPEAEMGRYLTEQGFANIAASAGRGGAGRSRWRRATRWRSRKVSSATKAMPGPGRSIC